MSLPLTTFHTVGSKRVGDIDKATFQVCFGQAERDRSERPLQQLHPTDEKILSIYYEMFAKEGKLEFEEETLGLGSKEDEGEEGGELPQSSADED